MKRSRVNDIIREADAFIRSFGYIMPPFAYWTPGRDARPRQAIGGILEPRLGWDITDYGQGKFDELGLFLFTVRNGRDEDLRRGGGMLYAEKIMISRKDQLSPMHRHNVKAEDIINRGGGKLVLEAVHVRRRRQHRPRRPRSRWRPTASLPPGCRPAGCCGSTRARASRCCPATGTPSGARASDVLIGEVSTVNDDLTDNIFAEPIGRFAEDRGGRGAAAPAGLRLRPRWAEGRRRNELAGRNRRRASVRPPGNLARFSCPTLPSPG